MELDEDDPSYTDSDTGLQRTNERLRAMHIEESDPPNLCNSGDNDMDLVSEQENGTVPRKFELFNNPVSEREEPLWHLFTGGHSGLSSSPSLSYHPYVPDR